MPNPIQLKCENSSYSFTNQPHFSERYVVISDLVANILSQIPHDTNEFKPLVCELKKFQNEHSNIEIIGNLRRIAVQLRTLNETSLSQIFIIKALAEGKREVNENPSYETYLEMGSIYDHLGMSDKCIEYYQPIVHLPAFEQLKNAPMICIKMGDHVKNSDKEFWYRKAIEIVESLPSTILGLHQKAMAFCRLGEKQNAIDTLTQEKAAIENDPETNFLADIPRIEALIQELSN